MYLITSKASHSLVNYVCSEIGMGGSKGTERWRGGNSPRKLPLKDLELDPQIDDCL